ncbi:hypothetical protein VTK26DRAFT_7701 [Humicola hyalothermophila]
MEQQIPLSHEASAGDTNMRVTTELPQEVVQCLENARFLHLATACDNIPHVSLMNYTYLPSSPYSRSPVIVMTTNPASKKTNNLTTNPNVSLLVHDWVSHRPTPTAQARRLSSGSGASASPTRDPYTHHHQHAQPPGPPPNPPSSLAALLFNLNTSALSSISATINGTARLVERGTPEERYYRDVHLANNTFDSGALDLLGPLRQPQNGGGEGGEAGAGVPDGTGRFAAGDEARVIVVGIRDVRIADWKGAVRDWVIEPPPPSDGEGETMVNGVR